MKAAINITGDMCSIKGAKDVNEDYALILPPYGACLADGMGGEQMGEAVARCACKVAMKAMAEGFSASESLERAQAYSRELVDNLDCGRSGAALTVVRYGDGNIEVAWAGDVECMRLSSESGLLQTVTKPDRGRRGLTNALGGSRMVVNTADCMLDPGDRILLCSDGVWENINLPEIRDSLANAKSPLEAAVVLTIGHKFADDATAVVLFANQ